MSPFFLFFSRGTLVFIIEKTEAYSGVDRSDSHSLKILQKSVAFSLVELFCNRCFKTEI